MVSRDAVAAIECSEGFALDRTASPAHGEGCGLSKDPTRLGGPHLGMAGERFALDSCAFRRRALPGSGAKHRKMPPPRTGNRRPGNARDRRCGADRFQSSPARLSACRIGRRDYREVNRSRVAAYASPFLLIFLKAVVATPACAGFGWGRTK
jgi:hypothetical protein